MEYAITLPRLGWSDEYNVNMRVDWCTENIGVRNVHWEVSKTVNQTNVSSITYCFKREQDLLMFTLKWK